MSTPHNTWAEFRDIVLTLLATDANRLGLQDSAGKPGYLSRVMSQAVLDLQEYVTILREGHESTLLASDAVVEGVRQSVFATSPSAPFTRPRWSLQMAMAALTSPRCSCFPGASKGDMVSGQLIITDQDWNCRINDRKWIQFYNQDTGAWHSLIATGSLAQPCQDDGTQPTLEPARSFRRRTEANYRVKDGKWIQLYSTDSGHWHTVISAGIPAQLALDDGVAPPSGDRNYRLRDGKGLQIFNSDTGLWHTILSTGTPAQLGQDLGESFQSAESCYVAINPTRSSLLIYPTPAAWHSARFVWDGNKSNFADTDPVPFPEEAALAVAEFVKGYIAREVDGDIAKLQTYFHPREGSYIKARTKLFLSSRRNFS